VSCRFVPGFLVPDDLANLRDPSMSLFDWAREHLLASPGAIVVRQGEVFRIRTLVPARQSDGLACHWLADGKCAVHADAPFGCAFVDSHMDEREGRYRSSAALLAVIRAWEYEARDPGCEKGLYARVWTDLQSVRRFAPGPEASRRAMMDSIGSLYPITQPRPAKGD
jgi:hypothetical protein